MSGHGDKLSQKQEAAVAALLVSGSIGRAAESVGLSERTLRRWLREPEFRAAYLEARRQVVDHSVTLLQSLSASAVHALGEAVRDGRTGEKIKAARAILDLAIKGVETADLAEQLVALQAELDALKQRRR